MARPPFIERRDPIIIARRRVAALFLGEQAATEADEPRPRRRLALADRVGRRVELEQNLITPAAPQPTVVLSRDLPRDGDKRSRQSRGTFRALPLGVFLPPAHQGDQLFTDLPADRAPRQQMFGAIGLRRFRQDHGAAMAHQKIARRTQRRIG